MAASHWMVAPSVERIERIVKRYASSRVIEVTNKRVFVRCPDKVAADNLATCIKDEDFDLEVRKGLKSQAFYIQVFL